MDQVSNSSVMIEAIFNTVIIMASDVFKTAVTTKSTMLLWVNNF